MMVVEVILIKKRLEFVFVHLKCSFNDTFFRFIVQGFGIGPLAHDEAQGTQQDGFTSTRFAGDDGQAFGEVDFEFLDDGVIADGKLLDQTVSGEW